jgi:hypothetical protein
MTYAKKRYIDDFLKTNFYAENKTMNLHEVKLRKEKYHLLNNREKGALQFHDI